MRYLQLLFTALFFVSFNTQAQEQAVFYHTEEGNLMFEVSTNFGGMPNTGFYLRSGNGFTDFNLGGEVGYFVMDDLALKGGLAFGSQGERSIVNYKFGAKYYIDGEFPAALDFAGISYEDADENPFFLGLQGGYAFFLSRHVSIEPGMRYNVSLNSDASDGVFEMNIGLALFL